MPIDTNLRRCALYDFAAVVCRCGATKQEQKSFCLRCFLRLPPAMRKALYQRFGAGYEEAYRDALRFLVAAQRIREAPDWIGDASA